MTGLPLEPLELRVLGVLMEKELSTPEYYPLTLNALVNGCNQSSNRDPVVAVTEPAVAATIESLRERRLVIQVQGAGSRVVKFGQRFAGDRNLALQEAAVFAELLLRGPQTPGELRSRCTRMYPFQALDEVEAALAMLAEAEEPLVVKLARAPGMKESRYAQLLGGAVATQEAIPLAAPTGLAARVASLEEQLAGLRAEFEAFRKQFE
jgi:uncharacterized protein YceH (UPF0502 family)